MAFDESALEAKHELIRFNVRGGTQISTRATSIISKLASVLDKDAKSPLIVLHASSREANKLISVVEIVKRDLTAKSVNFCQYTALSSKIVEVERTSKATTPEHARADAVEGEESDDAFQTMGAVDGSGTKKRTVPMMTVYLSSQPVKELRNEYG
jgi:hypothetical protein